MWKFPDQLSFVPFPDEEPRLGNITLSDEERGTTINAVREAVLSCNDAQLQLQWARDSLTHVDVAESNRKRASEAFSATGQVPETESKLRKDAIHIVEYLAKQGHPEAVFMKAIWLEFGKFGYDTDKKKAFLDYKLASSKGYTRSWYRMGLAFESSKEGLKSITRYKSGVEADDAAALYWMGIMTIRGQYGQLKDFQRGLEML